jgi:hypothetical protein
MYGSWYLQKVISRNFFYRNLFFVGILKVNVEIAGSGSRIQIRIH